MKTTTTIKLDKKTKEAAQKFAKEIGIPLGTVINAQLKQFVRDRQIVLSETPRMSKYLEELLGPIEKDIVSGKNLSTPMKSSKDLDRFFAGL